jgi:regulatory protein
MKKLHLPSLRHPLLTPLGYAYQLLARRAYSEQALAEKMRAVGFTESAIARTALRLQEQGYLNDVRFAADQVERLRARGFGQEAIKTRLMQKGLPTEMVEQVLFEDRAGEQEAARRFLASRFSTDTLKDPQMYSRAYRMLIRRGYAQDVVETLLGSLPDPDL